MNYIFFLKLSIMLFICILPPIEKPCAIERLDLVEILKITDNFTVSKFFNRNLVIIELTGMKSKEVKGIYHLIKTNTDSCMTFLLTINHEIPLIMRRYIK